MQEGWLGDDYNVLLSPEEQRSATREYKVQTFFPDFSVVGIVGWDDLLLQDHSGATCRSPAVPLEAKDLCPYSLPAGLEVQPDSRFTGKIKWYTTPIVFGGSLNDKGNVVWVTHEQHRQVVAWWNEKYRELKAAQRGSS